MEDPTIYDITRKIQSKYVKTIKSVIICIEGHRELLRPQPYPDSERPTVWCNSITSDDKGTNRSRTEGGTVSKYADRPVMRLGSTGKYHAETTDEAGWKHTFELPVEYDENTGTVKIYFWAHDKNYFDEYTAPGPNFGMYYDTSMLGYRYVKEHAISLI